MKHENRMYFLTNQNPRQMMSFIIETADGKVIVVDGGYADDAQHLLDTLKNITGSEKPHVDAWLLTHAHSDHICALLKLVENGFDRLTIGALYYNFPSVQWLRSREPRDEGEVAGFLAARKYLLPISEIVTRGDSYRIGEAQIDVLFTYDPALTRFGINESSTVFRLTLGGQTVLFLGDLGIEAGEKLLSLYGDELKSDFVQMAHHGQNGVDKAVYQAVAPKGCLWCAPLWLWENDAGKGYDTHTFQTVIVRGWMSELHVKRHFVNKDGDHIIPLPFDFD